MRREADGTPILVRDVAAVTTAPLTRQGAATRDGRGEAVIGMVMMLYGENSREVVERAKARLDEIRGTLPKGVHVEIIYDRASLIGRALRTVLTNLSEGGLLVMVVLFLTLGTLRAGILVALAIPLSMMFATNLMAATGITVSLMSLGAIDFGLIVDSSVIMVENCIRRLADPPDGRSRMDIIRDAAIEVRKHTRKKIVTKAMHEVVFVAPVFVGDIVSFYTELVRVGRTSITIKVLVEADRAMHPGDRARVTEAEVVYVAIDDDRHPIPIRDET